MIGLLSATFGASLVGSLHCAGMCGPIMAFAVSDHPSLAPRRAVRLTPLAAYHLGRLIAYLTLGAISGALGGAFNLVGGALTGVQRGATILAGLMLIIIGGVSLLRHFAVRVPVAQTPAWAAAALAAGHRAARGMPPVARAAAIGALSGLIPCGWLYAFVVLAAGAGSATVGAAVMLAFWAGTIPILTGVGLCVQQARGILGARMQLAVSLALVGIGLYALSGRLLAPERFVRDATPSASSVDDLTTHVGQIESQKPACCRGEQ